MASAGLIARAAFVGATLLLLLYAVRHYLFAAFRNFLARPRDYSEIEGFHTPALTVIVPMHNEAEVAATILDALVSSDYPSGRVEILAVNDRSHDGTGAIIDDFASRYPAIRALHRRHGIPGKPSALQEATAQAKGEIIVIFDADYIPGKGILKMLVAPFADPQIGAVMGRVVPVNGGATLMSGLLSIERAGGYQVGQQARFNLGLAPQFGGTVGGVRLSALHAAGGWNAFSLTEDTDLTCRLLLQGWKIAYVNRAECYEQVPQSWDVRSRQLRRWAIGHNECFHRFGWQCLHSSVLTLAERTDLFLMLGCYWTAPLLIIAWLASLVLFLGRQNLPSDAWLVALLVIGSQTFASQASFFEITVASFLDQAGERILLLPLAVLNFAASTGAVCGALWTYYAETLFGSGEFDWHKTIRYPGGNGNGNGKGHGNGNGGASAQ